MKMDVVSLATLVLVVVCCGLADGGRLNDYILDYQPLTYDRQAVARRHHRARRSADPLSLKFTAYKQHFHLELTPAEGVFSQDHHVITSTGRHFVDTSFIYQGRVKDVPNSFAHISVVNGSMEGHIEMPDERYYIEPASKYVPGASFHTIIYPEKHLDKDPYRSKREAHKGSCGIERNQDFLREASQVEEDPQEILQRKTREAKQAWEGRYENMYSEYSNRAKRASGERHKRALGATSVCPLQMKADPLLFQWFRFTKHNGDVGKQRANEEIIAFFSEHVTAISKIYRDTTFETYNKEFPNVGLSFVIYSTEIMDAEVQNCANTYDSRYCENRLDVSNYLDLTSRDNHDEYCLVFTFTYRDFSGGTLGLAWVATENNPQSGVCATYTTYTGGVKKSLNTGIVTTINFGKTVANRVSQLTFAHEVGHNFGSPHDIGSPECAPFGTSRTDANLGNYIMFPSATSGDKSNNDKFSACSRDNMTRIIEQVVTGNSGRANCFAASGEAFCGNRITEKGEECDCGLRDCAPSTCCNGKQLSNGNPNPKGCKLVENINCSPDSGPCCNSTCFYKSNAVMCEDATECKQASSCTGFNFTCPAAVHKADNSWCDNYSKVCTMGECIGSVCARIGTNWTECFRTTDNNAADSELCYVACQNPAGECISSTNTDALAKLENKAFKDMLDDAYNERNPGASASVASDTSPLAIMLPAGSACDNYRGYCDTFSKCQRIDSQGPFTQLTNMIFDPVTLNLVKDWIVEHWWAAMLMAVGLVVFMGVFIKVCSYNTPSKDPKTQARRRPQNPRQQLPNRQPGRSSGHPSSQPYNIGMDMQQIDRRSQAKYPPHQQFDRIAQGGYGKHHI